MDQPKILIIAGPNGAGKTTFAKKFLPHEAICLTFINADLIAAGLSPFAPELAAIQAARLMLQSIHNKTKNLESIAIETTLSGRCYAKAIPKWQAQGYRVKLIFLSLASANIAVSRVQQRVMQGGHHIPESIINRRFNAGLFNFQTIYKPIVDAWSHIDNTNNEPILLDWKENE